MAQVKKRGEPGTAGAAAATHPARRVTSTRPGGGACKHDGTDPRARPVQKHSWRTGRPGEQGAWMTLKGKQAAGHSTKQGEKQCCDIENTAAGSDKRAAGPGAPPLRRGGAAAARANNGAQATRGVLAGARRAAGCGRRPVPAPRRDRAGGGGPRAVAKGRGAAGPEAPRARRAPRGPRDRSTWKRSSGCFGP